MKRLILSLLISGTCSFMFSQQWSGSNNTTSDISRTGKVNIDNTTTVRRLHINTNTVTNNPDISLSAQAMIETESNMFLNIDSDNNTNNAALTIGKNSPTTTGYNALFKIHEAGSAYLYSGHYRNYGDGGLYNQTDGTYLYSDDKNYFKLRTERGLKLAGKNNTMRGYLYHNNADGFGLLDRHGNWVFRSELDSYNSFLVDNKEKMRVTNLGRVGIGTTSPSYLLHTKGDVYADGGWFRVSGNRGLFFQTHGGGFYMKDDTWIRTYNNKSFYHNSGIMRTDGTFQVGSGGNRFLVSSSGKVGIGETNPIGSLHVKTGTNSYGMYLSHTHGKRGLTINNDYGSSNTILPYTDGRSYVGGKEVVLRAGQSNKEGFRVKEDGSTKVKSLSHNYSGYLPVYVDKDGNLVTGGRGTTTIPPGLKEDGDNSKKSANNVDVCQTGTSSVNSAWTPVKDGLLATSSENENEMNNFCIKDRANSTSPWHNNKFVYINREGSVYEPGAYGHTFFNYPAQFIVHGGNAHGGMQFSTSDPGSVAQMEFVNQGKQTFWALSSRADADYLHVLDDGEDGNDSDAPWLRDRFALYYKIGNQFHSPFSVFGNGQVVIGDGPYTLPYGTRGTGEITQLPKLSVKGTIVTEEILLQQFADWADYVFEEDYNLKSLSDVEKFIEENGHLPNIPSAKEIKENGLSAKNMFRMHMEKIEELTLHSISQEKSLKSKEKEIETLEKRIENLEKLFYNIQNKKQ